MKKLQIRTGVVGILVGLSALTGCAPEKPEKPADKKDEGVIQAQVEQSSVLPPPPFEIVVVRPDGERDALGFREDRGFFTEKPIAANENDEVSLEVGGENRLIRWSSGGKVFDSPSNEPFNFSRSFGNQPQGWKGEIYSSTRGSARGVSQVYPIEVKLAYTPPRQNLAFQQELSGSDLSRKPYNLAEDYVHSRLRAEWFTFSHGSKFGKKLWIRLPEVPIFRTVTKIAQYFKHTEGPRGYLRSGIYYSVVELAPLSFVISRASSAGARTETVALARGWTAISVGPGETVAVDLLLNTAQSGGPVMSAPTPVGPCLRAVAGDPPCFAEISSIDLRSKFPAQMILADQDDAWEQILRKLRSDPDSVQAVFGAGQLESVEWKVLIGLPRDAFSDQEWLVAQPLFQPRGDVIFVDSRTSIESRYW